MSGTQVSSAPNVLFDPMMAVHQQEGQNQLLQQQQDIGGHEMEMASRLAGTLLSQYQTPEARAAAYPTLLASARAAAPGYFKNAPSSYPGDDATHALFQLGTSSAEQFKLGQAGTAIPTPGFNTGAAAPGSTAPAAPAAPGATIGQRQNNPGNLTFAGQPYASPGQGNRFASFPDMATGVAANADQLALYQTQHGINTVRGAVTRWVGDPKADLTSYVGDIAKSLGVGPDDKIDLTDPAVQAKFIQAQFPHESAGGGYVLNPADVAKGVQMAAGRRGQQVQPTPTPVVAAATPPAAPGGVAARTGGTDVAGPGAGSGTATAAQAPLPPDQAKARAATTGQPVPVAGVQGLWALPDGTVTQTPPTATPASAQQPPAAPATAPAQVAPVAVPAPPEMDQSNLTRQDYQDLDRARRSGMTGPQLTQEVQQRQVANLARQEKYRGDVRQAANDAQAANEKAKADAIAAENLRLSQESGQRDTERLRLSQQDDQRKAEQLRLSQAADQRAAEKAAQEARAANRPVQGNDVDAQHESYLYEHANEIRDGTASEDVKRQYAGSYYALQQRGGQALQITDPNNPGGTIAATITRRLPSSLPEPPGGALPEVLTTPGAAKAPQMTEPQSQAAGFADRMVNALPIITDTSPAAMSRWQQLLGKVPLAGNSFVSSEFQQHIQAERDFINAVLRKESGAAISESEFVNARQQYIPQPGDQPAVLAQKAKNRETVLANLTRDAGPAYKPPAATSSSAAAPPPPKGFKVIQ